MAIVQIDNGKVAGTSASNQSLTGTMGKDKSNLGKEDFLNLLVAQMKYQDPLEPTSNTEYISQLATFSSLEEMQNINTTMKDDHASSLVGKTVMVKITTSTGQTSYETGRVDYVMRENGKVYLSIKDGLYSIDDVDSVIDEDYLDAVTVAETFVAMLKALPNTSNISMSDKSKVDAVLKAYGEMTDYQKQFLGKDVTDKVKEIEDRMNEVVARDEATKFNKMVDGLPSLDKLTVEDKEKVEAIRKTYDGYTKYQKEFIDKDVLEKLEKAEEKIKELTA